MARGKKNNQPTKAEKRAPTAEPLASGDESLESWLPAPGELVNRLRDEVDHLFDEFGIGKLTGSWPSLTPESLETWTPQVEAFERAGQFVIHADLPGVTRDDITVELSDSSITIAGKRTQEHEENTLGYFRSERRYGRFLRRIPLPDGVKVETAKSNFRNGVLEITMASPAIKAEAKARQTRKLEIEDASVSPRARARRSAA